jgi:flagellum-specific peptidoglycan hydrolase FlgJ
MLPVIRSVCLLGVLIVATMWSDVLSPTAKAKNSLTERKETCMTTDNLPDTVSKEIKKPLMPTNLTTVEGRVRYALASNIASKNRGKTISITEIVKDEKMLAFICHNQVLARAKWVQDKTGLNTVTVLAQKANESNYGKSSLCATTKNGGNIKCTRKSCKRFNIKLTRKGQKGSTTAHCTQLWDDSPRDRFLNFETLYEGWEGYADLINKSYRKAANCRTVKDEIRGLKARGYATARNYVVNVYSVVTKCNLLELQKYIDSGWTITTSGGRYVLLQQ